ncbi:MAG TPA: HAMP domain-containing sensor histidine kinase [Bacillota bacterium]|nr:HAMP domain-containing sensor histidine kinase [Bacillota bacterium]HPL53785.1 HAMP domain-containing sensor histidine kinase [Bacillota bacterium]
MLTGEMKVREIKYPEIFLTGGIFLIALGMLFPVFSQNIWFGVIIKTREAIITGDSGHLILASAFINCLYSLQSIILYMGTMLVVFYSRFNKGLKSFDVFLFSLIIIILLHWTSSLIFEIPWEPVSTILALVISLFLFERLFGETYSFIQVFIVSIQVFFAFHWLNIMPSFSPYRFGRSDILYGVKIAGVYLNADTVLNFTGFAFFLPFIISAFITATLFISYSQNIRMVRENYEKETEIRNMRTEALENRVYQEVKSLVHDLKTPLVTIRGLNSLMLSSNGHEKLSEYGNRIENSVTKMSEMISGYLYESSRQKIKTIELINFIRAQLPLEDERIKFVIDIQDELPDIYVNKIRIARAVINILENAIIVPHKQLYKLINVTIKTVEKGIKIIVRDNGIGIGDLEMERIWEIGYSSNNTSGMGLPFAKRVIEDNMGTIEIASQLDEGTTVTVFLPSVDSLEIDDASNMKA